MKWWLILVFSLCNTLLLSARVKLSVQRAALLVSERASATFWAELEAGKGVISNYEELKALYDKNFSPLDYAISCESKYCSKDVNAIYQIASLTAAGLGDFALEHEILKRWGAYPSCDKWHLFIYNRGYLKRKATFRDVAFHWLIPGNGKESKKHLSLKYEILRIEMFDNVKRKTESTIYLNRKEDNRKIVLFKFNHDHGRRIELLPSQDCTKIAILFHNVIKNPEISTTVMCKEKSTPVVKTVLSNQLELYIVDCDNPIFQDRLCILKSWDDAFLKDYTLKEFSWENTLDVPLLLFEKNELIEVDEI